ncbi:Sphingosine-1-phosphate lyase [Bienertia sinuspersici]
MGSPSPSSSSSSIGAETPKKTTVSLFRNAMKRKHSFIQFFAMSGILFLSVRSLGQKYRIYDLQEDMAALQDEQRSLTDRINHIKSSLRHEASLDSSGIFASRLRRLFGDDQ